MITTGFSKEQQHQQHHCQLLGKMMTLLGMIRLGNLPRQGPSASGPGNDAGTGDPHCSRQSRLIFAMDEPVDVFLSYIKQGSH